MKDDEFKKPVVGLLVVSTSKFSVVYSLYTYATNPLINLNEINHTIKTVNDLEKQLSKINLSQEEKMILVNQRMNQSFFRKSLIK